MYYYHSYEEYDYYNNIDPDNEKYSYEEYDYYNNIDPDNENIITMI